MLVLSRKLNQSIVIGDDVRVTIVGIEGKQVKLGVEAPLKIRVIRLEVEEREREAGQTTDF